MVKFCEMCGNLFSHKIDEQMKFIYHCDFCGHENQEVTEKCIVVNELNRNAHDSQLNPNMIHDHALPRTKQIPCPTCHRNTEIIIFQYNPEMLNVGYMCTECKTYWKN
jgi:DNA-directed RNA polymerase subunit M/transcription elongation factor TFIIS